jgi:hypothetical protein
MRHGVTRKLDGSADSARQGYVIVLYQNAVIQPEPMIGPATDRDRILFKYPEARRCLSRIRDSGAVALNSIDKSPGERGYSRQPLHDVERRPLPREQSGGGPFDSRELCPGIDPFAIINPRLEHHAVVERAEDRFGDFKSAQHEVLFGKESPASSRPAAHDALSCDVAAAQVFLQQIGRKSENDSGV